MLIGIDASRAVARQPTGTEHYSLHLIRSLAQIATPRHTLRLYLRDMPDADALPRGGSVEWRLLGPRRLWTHVGLATELLRDPPDLLYVPAHVLPILARVPSVATVHDLGYRHHPETHTARSRWYLEWSTRHNARQAAHLIVDSRATAHDLERLLGVPPSKMTVAYPAGSGEVERVSDEARVAAVRQRHGLAGPYMIAVGTLHPRKNLELLVDAFGDLCTSGEAPEALRIVLAGKRGWMWEPLLARIRERGLEGRVLCTGYLDPAEISALLTGAVAMVMPSLYEGFGLPVLEAMACDLPVIISNASSLPEVGGDATLYVDPHDQDGWREAMARVLVDTDLRQEMVRKGREQLARFSWERCAATVLSVLEGVGDHG